MTVQIALCDDEIEELDKIEKLLNIYEERNPNVDFMVRSFESADTLLAMVEQGKLAPEIIFMDIFMPGETGEKESLGMDAAKQFQKMENKSKLVFFTTSKEYALEAFDVDAAGYLVKPVSEEKLFSVLDKFLLETEQERRKYIVLKIDGNIMRVPLSDVVYCEAQRKQQSIYLADGTELRQTLTMAKLYEMCSVCREFVRMGASYIINLEHIERLNAEELCLDTGKKIYLPRGTYRCLREQYFDYYCGKEVCSKHEDC